MNDTIINAMYFASTLFTPILAITMNMTTSLDSVVAQLNIFAICVYPYFCNKYTIELSRNNETAFLPIFRIPFLNGISQ